MAREGLLLESLRSLPKSMYGLAIVGTALFFTGCTLHIWLMFAMGVLLWVLSMLRGVLVLATDIRKETRFLSAISVAWGLLFATWLAVRLLVPQVNHPIWIGIVVSVVFLAGGLGLAYLWWQTEKTTA